MFGSAGEVAVVLVNDAFAIIVKKISLRTPTVHAPEAAILTTCRF